MRSHMKSGLTLIAAVIFSGFQFGWAQAANLECVRTGEHGAFTRIVFEFQEVARFEKVVIKGKREFSVVFLDSSTVVASQILHKITQPVHSIELVRQGSQLAANITLSFPFSRLKTFFLSGPDRVVIDAYRVASSAEEPLPKGSLYDKPPAKVLTEFAERKPRATPKGSSTEAVSNQFEIEPRKAERRAEGFSGQILSQSPAMTKEVQGAWPEKTSQEPGAEEESRPYFIGHYNVQTYLLVLLNVLLVLLIVFIVFIIALLSFKILKDRPRIDSRYFDEVADSLKTTDKNIATIDGLIRKELKKHDQS